MAKRSTRGSHSSTSPNPLKREGQRKSTTSAEADRRAVIAARRSAVDTTTHEASPPEGGEPARPGTKRRGPSPADAPSSARTGTAPDRSGGPSRSGSTGSGRRRKGRTG